MENTFKCSNTSCSNYLYNSDFNNEICSTCVKRQNKKTSNILNRFIPKFILSKTDKKKKIYFIVFGLYLIIIALTILFFTLPKSTLNNNVSNTNHKKSINAPSKKEMDLKTQLSNRSTISPDNTPENTTTSITEKSSLDVNTSPDSTTSVASITTVSTNNVTPSPANTQTPSSEKKYSIDYVITRDWGLGASINITINNTGDNDINTWTVVWEFDGDQEIKEYWKCVVIQESSKVEIKNPEYSPIIPISGSVNFGFNISFSDNNEIPTNIVVI